jgi:hypothetical protein
MRGSVLGGELRRIQTKLIRRNGRRRWPPSFLSTPPWSSCSRQVCGSLEEVDQESKRVTPETERGGVLRVHAR